MTISPSVARLAINGALFTCLFCCPQARGEKYTPSNSDYWRPIQAQQAAADYYRYARKQQSSSSGYNQYGHFGPAFERIDGMLGQNRQHFSDYEINDLSSRVYGLKQRIAANVSQGFETNSFLDDISSLEAEVSRKVDDSLVNISSVERHLNDTLIRVEELFSAHKNKMPDSDYEELETRIKRLRDRTARDLLVTHGVGSNNYSSDFSDEARKIESAIIGKSLLHKPDKVEVSTDAAQARANKSDADKASDSQGKDSTPVHTGGLTSYRLQPTPTRQQTPPAPTLAKVFEKTENRLLDLHEAERLGTFDIDVFSERILKLKYNCKKMAAKTGTLSKRQEDWLRIELNKLNDEISERTHSAR